MPVRPRTTPGPASAPALAVKAMLCIRSQVLRDMWAQQLLQSSSRVVQRFASTCAAKEKGRGFAEGGAEVAIGNLEDAQLSLSRSNHWLPGREAHPEVVQGTAQFHHQITDALLPQADSVFHNAAALDAAVDMLDP